MSDEAQRQAFEQWFFGGNKVTPKRDGDSYSLMSAHSGWKAWQAAIASQPKPAPVLLTDEEKREILKGAFGIDPAFDGHLMRMAADIESAAHRKNGWGV